MHALKRTLKALTFVSRRWCLSSPTCMPGHQDQTCSTLATCSLLLLLLMLKGRLKSPCRQRSDTSSRNWRLHAWGWSRVSRAMLQVCTTDQGHYHTLGSWNSSKRATTLIQGPVHQSFSGMLLPNERFSTPAWRLDSRTELFEACTPQQKAAAPNAFGFLEPEVHFALMCTGSTAKGDSLPLLV